MAIVVVYKYHGLPPGPGGRGRKRGRHRRESGACGVQEPEQGGSSTNSPTEMEIGNIDVDNVDTENMVIEI